MIKVLIVVSGLVLFVPDDGADPRGMTVLLRDTTAFGAGMWDHQPLLQVVGEQAPLNRDRQPFTANVSVAAPRGAMPSIDLTAFQDVPQLGELVAASADGEVPTDCLAGTCVDAQGRRKVVGVVRFEGGWRTRSLQRCTRQWNRPVDFLERVELDFRRKESDTSVSAAHPRVARRRLATGIALEAQVENLNALTIVVNGRRHDVMQPAQPMACEEWLGDRKTPCVVIELENWPPHDDPLPERCKNISSATQRCRLDEHFAALYDLTAGGPQRQPWLPYAASAPGGNLRCLPSSSGAGNPPAVRCPPASAKPQPTPRPTQR